jgi:uracil-DNA glycosylase
MMDDEKTEALNRLAEQVRNLTASPLYDYRVKNGYSSVFGEGDAHSQIMFIGEAPGEREAKTGRPFVGASGRFLDELLRSVGIPREEVYITNVVKDRPPENRDPTPQEIELYSPFLMKQIEIILPKVIATLGRFAMDFILKQYEMREYGGKISQLHGKVLEARTDDGKISIIPLFHPAVAIYNQNSRTSLEKDFQILRQFIE